MIVILLCGLPLFANLFLLFEVWNLVMPKRYRGSTFCTAGMLVGLSAVCGVVAGSDAGKVLLAAALFLFATIGPPVRLIYLLKAKRDSDFDFQYLYGVSLMLATAPAMFFLANMVLCVIFLLLQR